jgi:hypothetical protein
MQYCVCTLSSWVHLWCLVKYAWTKCVLGKAPLDMHLKNCIKPNVSRCGYQTHQNQELVASRPVWQSGNNS